MRGPALTAAAVLLLAGCGDGAEQPEPPEPGPLDIASGEMTCHRGEAGAVVVAVSAPGNTADIPLTIDEVALVGADNAVLDEAFVGSSSAIDFTMAERMQLGGRSTLTLVLRPAGPSGAMTVDAVAVDYHNVEGRFRAMSASLDVTSDCRP
ncbi:MAG TPA: hypothetical protein VFK41_11460 [Nocardioidaceae bacterium]|nr:hypothetical protein [Nocardioidaceae bacterium]